MHRKLLATTVMAGALLASGNASALSLSFSGYSSDATSTAFLAATLDFAVSNTGGNDLLTLTLTNLSDTTSTGTDPDNGFTISRIFFNYTGNANLFSVNTDPLGGASLAFNQSAGGFGTFDVLLDLGTGNAGLDPSPPTGSSATWVIDLGDTGITDSDFNLESTLPPGSKTSVAALFFTQGPCDPEITGSCVEDSAFGTVVPIPAAAWLFGSGLLGLAGVARRRSR